MTLDIYKVQYVTKKQLITRSKGLFDCVSRNGESRAKLYR